MLPIKRKNWLGIKEEIKDLLHPKGPFRVYTGHSPLANVGYITLYLGVVFSIVSGFTLYAQGQYSPFWRGVSAAGLALFGNNLNTVHLLHHLGLWFFGLFLVVHLYLIAYTIIVSCSTEVDTMISGRKFVLEDHISVHSD